MDGFYAWKAALAGLAAFTKIKAWIYGVKGGMLAMQLAVAGNTAALGSFTVAQRIFGAGLGVMKGKIALAKVAKLALNAAFLASPVGWLVVGVGLLTASLVSLTRGTERQKTEQQRLRAETDRLIYANATLAETIEASQLSHEDRLGAIDAEIGADRQFAFKVRGAYSAGEGLC